MKAKEEYYRRHWLMWDRIGDIIRDWPAKRLPESLYGLKNLADPEAWKERLNCYLCSAHWDWDSNTPDCDPCPLCKAGGMSCMDEGSVYVCFDRLYKKVADGGPSRKAANRLALLGLVRKIRDCVGREEVEWRLGNAASTADEVRYIQVSHDVASDEALKLNARMDGVEDMTREAKAIAESALRKAVNAQDSVSAMSERADIELKDVIEAFEELRNRIQVMEMCLPTGGTIVVDKKYLHKKTILLRLGAQFLAGEPHNRRYEAADLDWLDIRRGKIFIETNDQGELLVTHEVYARKEDGDDCGKEC
jgi:hypothetical protein